MELIAINFLFSPLYSLKNNSLTKLVSFLRLNMMASLHFLIINLEICNSELDYETNKTIYS